MEIDRPLDGPRYSGFDIGRVGVALAVEVARPVEPARYVQSPFAEHIEDAAPTPVPDTVKPQALPRPDEPPALTMDAGSGGNKPPIDRRPQDGVSEPEEPAESGEDHVEELGALEGEIITGKAPRPVEVRHSDDKRYDVVINRRHPDHELARYAAGEIENGIPESWLQAETPGGRVHYTDPSKSVYVKLRHEATPATYGMELDRRVARAHYSVLNEIGITEDVGRVLARDANVQDVLDQEGIADLVVPQPIAALCDTDTGKKAVVSPWQEGVPVLDGRTGLPNVPEEVANKVEKVVRAVDAALIQKGIVPADHDSSQYLVDIDKESGAVRLVLTDCGMFHKVPPEVGVREYGEPTLTSGGVEHWANHQWYEWSDSEHRDSGGDPRVSQCEPGGMLVGRRNETDLDQSPILQAQLEGGRAVVIWNERTGEGGIIPFSQDMMHVEDAHFHAIDELRESVPALGMPDVRAWVVGDEVSGPVSKDAWFGNEGLWHALWEVGIGDPHILSAADIHRVELRVSDGTIRLYDEYDNQLLV